VSVVGTRSAYHARPIDDQREENAAPRGPLVTQGRWSCSEYLNAWRINLSRPMSEPEVQPLRLVELVPTAIERSDSRYVVRVGELAIEVHTDFDDATLVRLVRALRSC
jgi:hypothetical protein